MVPLKKLPAPSLPTGTDQPALATGRKAVLVSGGGKGTGHSQQPYAPFCISDQSLPGARLADRTTGPELSAASYPQIGTTSEHAIPSRGICSKFVEPFGLFEKQKLQNQQKRNSVFPSGKKKRKEKQEKHIQTQTEKYHALLRLDRIRKYRQDSAIT